MNDFIYSYPMKVYFGEDSAKKAFTAELGRFGKNVYNRRMIIHLLRIKKMWSRSFMIGSIFFKSSPHSLLITFF